MTDREAMKMALAKLEHLWEIGIDAEYKVELLPEIEVLRQALAQPEQEPVAWQEMVVANLVRLGVVKHKAKELAYHFYTYDPPPRKEWVGLTLDDMPETYAGDKSFLNIAKWAEAKLKEKNT